VRLHQIESRSRLSLENDLNEHMPDCRGSQTTANDEGKEHKPAHVPFQRPNTVPIAGCGLPELLMGHGLVAYRSQNYISEPVRVRLENDFQKGVTNSSNRKGVLEMVETCMNTLPVLMTPSIQAVSSWLAGRLKKEPSSGRANKPKSLAGWRQAQAETLSNPHYQARSDETKRHLFLAKYRDVLLVKDGVTRIITSVQFDAARSTWAVLAARAKQDRYDDRIYHADTEMPDVISIDVKRGKDKLQGFIKDFTEPL
jgi:hypothetical protein